LIPQHITIRKIHTVFARHDRQYCIFSIAGGEEEYLYYSHRSLLLHSLIFGMDFLGQLPHIIKNEDLCIECGLGLSVAGGVAFDSGDCVEWNCSTADANQVLLELKEKLADMGRWIEFF
jgi:hypothetical protein